MDGLKSIHPVKYLRDYLAQNIRPDGREFLEVRPFEISGASLKRCNSSTSVKIGNTVVICGIIPELAEPKPDSPEDGFVVPNVELPPSIDSFSGPPSARAQILSKTMSDFLKDYSIVNLKDLCIEKGKLVWSLYIDLYCIDDDGCIVDASLTAMTGALATLKLPKVEFPSNATISDVSIDEDIMLPVPVRSLPVSTSFAVFDEEIIIMDPTRAEEKLSHGSVTVVLSQDELFCIQAPGCDTLQPKQVGEILSLARKQNVERLNSLRSSLKVEIL